MKRWACMGLVTLLAMGGAACNGGGGTDTGPGDTGPSDAVADMGPEGGNCDDAGNMIMTGIDAGNCYRAQPCNLQPFCPNVVVNDPMHPQFLIQQIDVAQPATLMSTALRSILNGALVDGTFGWGIKLDLTANTITTGALQPGQMPQPGVGLFASTFSFDMGSAPVGDAGSANRWDPVMGTVTLTGESFSTSTIALITTPIYASDGSVLAELPLRDASMQNVMMTSNRNCIGLALGDHAFSSCVNNRWITTSGAEGGMMTSSGTLDAKITVADAMNVAIPMLGMGVTLCSLLAGADCSTPQSSWMHQPDTMTTGATMPNAWHLIANFAAVSTHIN